MDSAWRTDCPKRIKVTLRVTADTPAKDVRVKIYFCGADKNRLATFAAPSPIWANTPRGFEAVGLPDTLPKNRDVDVFFPITPELDRAWKSLVVVAADNDETVARARPINALKDLEFPESKTAKLLQN